MFNPAVFYPVGFFLFMMDCFPNTCTGMPIYDIINQKGQRFAIAEVRKGYEKKIDHASAGAFDFRRLQHACRRIHL
jgi:hypothetical protein